MKLSKYILITALILITACSTSRYGNDTPAGREQLEQAKALFAEHCKTAGVKIYRTARDVEGIFLMKVRPDDINFSKQYKMDDPYGDDLSGDAYLRMFLKGHYEANRKAINPKKVVNVFIPKGYAFVEAIDPDDGQRYRYTGSMQIVSKKDINAPNIALRIKKYPDYDINNYGFVLNKQLSTGLRPRYGVTYDDISTREDRDHWIAGSSLRVIDLKTNEVMAERIGYMMDYGQGSRSGGRSPWLMAANHACPGFDRVPKGNDIKHVRRGASQQSRQTQFFVERVLFPKEGE